MNTVMCPCAGLRLASASAAAVAPGADLPARFAALTRSLARRPGVAVSGHRAGFSLLAAPISIVEALDRFPGLPLAQILSPVYDRISVRIPHAPAIRVAGWPNDVAIFISHSAKMPSRCAINQHRHPSCKVTS